MSRICFIDTETTSLRPDRRAWDIALIIREDGKPDVEHQWYVEAQDLDLGNADPFALKIGHFYDRHPSAGSADRFVSGDEPESYVLRQVELLTRGAHLIGCVPNFDAEVLGTRMRAHGILPSWHYHLIDVETLGIGWLMRKKQQLQADEPTVEWGDWPTLPWKSEEVSRALDIEPPLGEDRHTAIGDAGWARDIYDAVMGKAG